MRGIGVIVAVIAVVAGWYLVRNVVHYGELWPFEAERDNIGRILPQSIVSRSIVDPLFRGVFLQEVRESFWYRGGWGQVKPPETVYFILDVLLVPLAVGVVGVFVNRARLGLSSLQGRALLLLLAAFALMFAGDVYSNLRIQQFQGRHLFPALPAFGLLAVLGVAFLLPERLRNAAYAGVPLFLLGLSVFILVRVAAPAY